MCLYLLRDFGFVFGPVVGISKSLNDSIIGDCFYMVFEMCIHKFSNGIMQKGIFYVAQKTLSREHNRINVVTIPISR